MTETLSGFSQHFTATCTWGSVAFMDAGILEQDSSVRNQSLLPRAGAAALRAKPLWLFLPLVVMAALLNVHEFSAIEARTWAGYHALHSIGNRGLIKVLRRKLGTVRQRYAMAFSLADKAPGSTIYLPTTQRYRALSARSQLAAYGKVKKFVELDYDPIRSVKPFNRKRYRLAKTRKGSFHTYASHYLLLAKPKKTKKTKKHKRKGRRARKTAARSFLYLRHGKRDVLVDTSLLKGELAELIP